MLHPDKFASKDKIIQSQAENVCVVLNKAMSCLKNRLLRAKHLLLLKGVQVDKSEQEKSNEFVTEIFRIREEIENSKDENERKQIFAKNDQEIEKGFESFDLHMKKNDFENANIILNKIIFLIRIKESDSIF